MPYLILGAGTAIGITVGYLVTWAARRKRAARKAAKLAAGPPAVQANDEAPDPTAEE